LPGLLVTCDRKPYSPAVSTDFDSIFDQPDLIPPADVPGEVATTYVATAARTGDQWTATGELPDGQVVKARGGSWGEVGAGIADLIFAALRDEPGIVGVHVCPADPEAAAALGAVVEARQVRILAEQAERDAVRHAVRLLLGQGWSPQDAGSALRLTHERAFQFASLRPEQT
jgi:hypothetical protein